MIYQKPESFFERHASILVLLFTIIAIALMCHAAFGAQVFHYKCPKCQLEQNYSKPGIYKCPVDGATLYQNLQL